MEVVSFVDHLHYVQHCHRYIVKQRPLVVTMHLRTALLKLVVARSNEQWARVAKMLTIGALLCHLIKSLRIYVLDGKKTIGQVMLAFMGRRNLLMITSGSSSP
jgi:hypothetical protein